MKSLFTSFFSLLVIQSFAQTISFTDQVFKQRLLQSSPGNFIAQNLNGNYIAIDSNNNSQIEVAEALEVSNLNLENAGLNNINEISFFTNLTGLNCSTNNLQNLNLSSNPQLIELNCSNNSIQFLNLLNTTLLETIDCSLNLINTLNLNSSSSLKQLNCNNNNLSNINNLSTADQLVTLNCSNNSLVQLDFTNLVELKYLDCSFNLLTALNFNSNGQLINLRIDHNSLNTLTLINLNQLVLLDCSYNNLVQLVLQNLSSLNVLYFHYNQLNNVSFFGLVSLQNMNCSHNQLLEINTDEFTNLLNLNCSNNSIQSLNLNYNGLLYSLNANNNQITSLDCSFNSTLTNIEIQNNLLNQLNIKNGSTENLINFSNNPNLNYLCCDVTELNLIDFLIDFYSIQNCILNDFCQTPSNYGTLSLTNRIDSNLNTICDTNDILYPFLKFRMTDSNAETVYFANENGVFSTQLAPDYYTVFPEIENAPNFTISPTDVAVDLPADSPSVNSFCIGHQANNNDLELVLFPVSRTASTYTLGMVIKNNGNTMAQGIVGLTYVATAFSFLNASLPANSLGSGIASWNFQDLKPGERKILQITFQLIGLPANGLLFNGSVTSVAGPDSVPSDNTFALVYQDIAAVSLAVSGLKGTGLNGNNLLAFQYYAVVYTNTTGQPLNQLKIQLPIANSDYDASTFWPIYSNNNVVTRQNNLNVVLFFTNMNLAVNQKITFVFKIKTQQNLQIGSSITMLANAFVVPSSIAATGQFDSTVQNLDLPTLNIPQIIIFPNPCTDFLSFQGNNFTPTHFEISDINGSILKSERIINNSIATSFLKNGIYFIRFTDGTGSLTKKIVKFN